MADHMMMPINHNSAGASLHGYRMGMNGGMQAGHQQHAAQQGVRTLPGGQMMHYGSAQATIETTMRQRQGLVGGPMSGAQVGHHHMTSSNMIYTGQQQQQPQQQQQQHHHHHHHPQQQQQQHHVHAQQHQQQQHQQHQQQQHQQQHQQQQFMNGGLTSQQLMASMQLQKLNTQYHGHPLGPMAANHMGATAQYRMNPTHLVSMQHMAGPTLALNGMDADMIDEDVLTSLVMELGLDRVQELPELFLGQNEFDFISDFVSKQQPSTVTC
ncbi:cbp/p300-interacting transactivator 3-like [Takifugu rubripes]|uniref:cbp/p300-interacting transactivator 3-like n=1 Tax=Takifugu rubripes TaxID=31033 RepID=UPI0011453744|nr:cbp/p300-interacting transactivator 3-like [Takifugu rubripes]